MEKYIQLRVTNRELSPLLNSWTATRLTAQATRTVMAPVLVTRHPQNVFITAISMDLLSSSSSSQQKSSSSQSSSFSLLPYVIPSRGAAIFPLRAHCSHSGGPRSAQHLRGTEAAASEERPLSISARSRRGPASHCDDRGAQVVAGRRGRPNARKAA